MQISSVVIQKTSENIYDVFGENRYSNSEKSSLNMVNVEKLFDEVAFLTRCLEKIVQRYY